MIHMNSFIPMWGLKADIPPEVNPGQMYFTLDTGEIYVDVYDGSRILFVSAGKPSSLPISIAEGGTGGTDRNSARNKLGVPAQIGVEPSLSFPIGYGLLSSRGSLGNTAGSVPATDNYYYGVDMQAVLWGGPS